MKKDLMLLVVFLAAALIGMFPHTGCAEPQFTVDISGGSKGIEGFNVSIGNYYNVPPREVVVVHERGIPEEEIPVVYFLARHAHVSPDVIVNMRLRHKSWMDITLHYGLSPEIFYVPVPKMPAPPYGNAYGYYKKYPKNKWRKIRFDDHDIINQVNLKFMSEHHHVPVDQVMRSRSQGHDFMGMDSDYRGRGKHGGRKSSGQGNSSQPQHEYANEHQGHGKGAPGKEEKHANHHHEGGGKGGKH